MSYKAGFVALLGRPNVGKSTLLNAILGHKVAITAQKAQTTRNRITGILHRPDAQLILLDTPGIHRAQNELGKRMVKTSRLAAGGVDGLWHIVDISRPPKEEDRWVADICRNSGIPAWLIGNKADLVEHVEGRFEPYFKLFPYDRAFTVSALEETGLNDLIQAAMDSLPEGDPYFPEETITDQSEEFYVSEVIREKVLETTHDEVPHSVAVVVEERVPRSGTLIYVRATIFVERETQKAILIGQNGQMLKQIGLMSRKDLEEYYGKRVFLDLWVKVRRHWRDQESWLRRLGYRDPEKG